MSALQMFYVYFLLYFLCFNGIISNNKSNLAVIGFIITFFDILGKNI